MKISRLSSKALWVALAVFAIGGGSLAQTFTWDGGGTPAVGWAIDANWVGDNAPSSGFTAGDFVFDADNVIGGGTFTAIFNLGNSVASSLTLTGGAGNFVVSVANSSLTVDGVFKVNSGDHISENTGSGELRIGAHTVFDIATGASFSRNAALGGTGQLVKTGGGTLSINSGPGNTFTGDISLLGGTLQTGNDDNRFGDAANTLSMDGGILQFIGVAYDCAISRATTLDSGGGTIRTDTGAKYIRWNGAVSGDGMLTKTGDGQLYLNANNSYAGGTAVSAGILTAQVDGALGAGNVTVGAATLVLTNGAVNNYIGDLATLVLDSGSFLQLDFAGMEDVVSGLSLDGGSTWLDVGTYDAAALTGLGGGVYTGTGSLTVSPELASSKPLLHKTIYVILFGGQSNALGWGYHQYLLDSGSPLAEPQTDVDLFTGVEKYLPRYTLMNLQSGSANSHINSGTAQYPAVTNTPISRFGPELSLGRTVRDLIQIPNAKVAIIKHAVGGTSLYSGWRPDGTASSVNDGPYYKAFQTTVQAGLTALQYEYPDYGIEIIGMGWVQGEADCSTAQSANYFSNLTNFVADVRATFGSNLVFALSKLSPNQNTNIFYTTVRAAQQAAADADPRVVATETIGSNYLTAVGFYETDIHYMSDAYLQIGVDLGTALLTASGLDDDNDGLPDAWENGFEPGSAGMGNVPGADYDGDGLSDLQEYQAGTSPVDPTDRLDLSIDTGHRMQWEGKQDVCYQALVSTNLDSWTEFGTPVLLRDGNGLIEVDLAPYLTTNQIGYFKLHVQ